MTLAKNHQLKCKYRKNQTLFKEAGLTQKTMGNCTKIEIHPLIEIAEVVELKDTNYIVKKKEELKYQRVQCEGQKLE